MDLRLGKTSKLPVDLMGKYKHANSTWFMQSALGAFNSKGKMTESYYFLFYYIFINNFQDYLIGEHVV